MNSLRTNIDAAIAEGLRLLDNRPADAEAQARDLLARAPTDPAAHRLLAAALRRLGRIAEAEQAERAAIEMAAHEPALRSAALALARGELAAAERILRPFLQHRPDDAAALLMLAEIAAALGILAEAERLLRHAISLAPAYDEAQIRLAAILTQQARPAEAAALLKGLRQRHPDHVEAGLAEATTLAQLGNYGKATGILEDLLARRPGHAGLLLAYGNVLKTLGRTADAIVAYRAAIEGHPGMGEAWWSLAAVKTMRFSPTDVAAMETALARAGDHAATAFHLRFALGRAAEEAGDAEASFRHYAEGNRLRRSLLPHDADAATAEVRRHQALFTPAFFRDRQGGGADGGAPIFILGMPRAGSTLIEQILSSHSQVEGTSELPYVPSLIQSTLAEHWRDPGARYPDIVARIDQRALRDLGERYLEAARAHRKTDRPFFIDKLPNNWLNVGFIHLILPNARIIDARRHPLACGFSNFKQHFARGQAFAYDLADIGRYYRDYVELMTHFDQVLPGRIKRVMHERLVEDPEGEVRRLLDHLGLDFEPQCLRFHENARAVRTASAEQVRRPISREGLDQWRKFERWLGPLKDALGPALDFYPDAPPPH